MYNVGYWGNVRDCSEWLSANCFESNKLLTQKRRCSTSQERNVPELPRALPPTPNTVKRHLHNTTRCLTKTPKPVFRERYIKKNKSREFSQPSRCLISPTTSFDTRFRRAKTPRQKAVPYRHSEERSFTPAPCFLPKGPFSAPRSDLKRRLRGATLPYFGGEEHNAAISLRKAFVFPPKCSITFTLTLSFLGKNGEEGTKHEFHLYGWLSAKGQFTDKLGGQPPEQWLS